LKNKGHEEEVRRFAIFQCNTLEIFDYELAIHVMRCRRLADRADKELDEITDRKTMLYIIAPIQTISIH